MHVYVPWDISSANDCNDISTIFTIIKEALIYSITQEGKDSTLQTCTLFFQDQACGAVSLHGWVQSWNLWDELFPINSAFYPTSGINMQKNCWNMQFLSQLLMKCNIINNKV